MKQTVNFSQLTDSFGDSYKDNFSYEVGYDFASKDLAASQTAVEIHVRCQIQKPVRRHRIRQRRYLLEIGQCHGSRRYRSYPECGP